MKQKIFSTIFIIIMSFMVLFIMPNPSLAVTSNREYTIQSYDINMTVNEDNTFYITENITAYFNVSKHGIYRKIPLRNSIVRTDGTTSSNRAKITDIEVSEKYTTYNQNGYKVIQIGDANQTFTGEHSYTITYKYDIGKDPLKNADELYFNLIGEEWDTSISNVSFRITMPKSFDDSLLGFSSGNIGSTDSSNVTYSIDGNTIIGNTINTLDAGQALTVRLTLPEGYFIGTSSNIDVFSIFVIVLCIISVIAGYVLWRKYGKDEPVVETVEFYPPKGYNSAEVGFLYNGSADTKGIISLLIYLANKGYLKIEEIEEEGIFSKSKSFRITKIKDYKGNNEYERIFLEGLFKNSRAGSVNMTKAKEIMKEAKRQGEKIDLRDALEMSIDNVENKDSVTETDLYDSFYVTLDRIKSKMNTKRNKNKIFESSAKGKGKYVIYMIIAIIILITAKPVLEYGGIETLILALLFPRNRIYCVDRKYYRCNKNT